MAVLRGTASEVASWTAGPGWPPTERASPGAGAALQSTGVV